MVRAILDGRKTMTRRAVKPRIVPIVDECFRVNGKWCNHTFGYELGELCPYGQPGDRLWVRETWREMGSIQLSDGTIPKAEQLNADNRHVVYAASEPWEGPFRPSIHMPRWASRITLEVADVRVERLQNISEEDAFAEGIERGDPGVEGWGRFCYRKLWNSINEKREFGWDVNPWVWVIQFRRIQP